MTHLGRTRQGEPFSCHSQLPLWPLSIEDDCRPSGQIDGVWEPEAEAEVLAPPPRFDDDATVFFARIAFSSWMSCDKYRACQFAPSYVQTETKLVRAHDMTHLKLDSSYADPPVGEEGQGGDGRASDFAGGELFSGEEGSNRRDRRDRGQ